MRLPLFGTASFSLKRSAGAFILIILPYRHNILKRTAPFQGIYPISAGSHYNTQHKRNKKRIDKVAAKLNMIKTEIVKPKVCACQYGEHPQKIVH